MYEFKKKVKEFDRKSSKGSRKPTSPQDAHYPFSQPGVNVPPLDPKKYASRLPKLDTTKRRSVSPRKGSPIKRPEMSQIAIAAESSPRSNPVDELIGTLSRQSPEKVLSGPVSPVKKLSPWSRKHQKKSLDLLE